MLVFGVALWSSVFSWDSSVLASGVALWSSVFSWDSSVFDTRMGWSLFCISDALAEVDDRAFGNPGGETLVPLVGN